MKSNQGVHSYYTLKGFDNVYEILQCSQENFDLKMVLYHNYIHVHFHSTLKRLKRLKDLALTGKLLFPLLIKDLSKPHGAEAHLFSQTPSSNRYSLMLYLLYAKHYFPFSAKTRQERRPVFNTEHTTITHH